MYDFGGKPEGKKTLGRHGVGSRIILVWIGLDGLDLSGSG
jgi:hypothetical protein